MSNLSKETASVPEKVVQNLAASLGYSKVDTRTFETLTAFLSQYDGEFTPEALKENFLKFEDSFLDVALLQDCDFPIGFTSVSNHMSKDIITVPTTEPIIEFSRRILRRMVSGAPVVNEDGRLVGVVSTSDVVGVVARPESLANIEELTVKDVMTTYTLAVKPTSSVFEVLHTLLSFRLHRVIVVDEENRPQGIITSLDLCKLLNSILQELRAQLRQ